MQTYMMRLRNLILTADLAILWTLLGVALIFLLAFLVTQVVP